MDKKSAQETLQEDMAVMLAQHHSRVLSEQVRRGIQAKKLRNPNPKNFNQFIIKRELENDILLYPFTSNSMEEIAGKQLDSKHLFRIYVELTSNEDISAMIKTIKETAVKNALDDTDPIWNAVDIGYKDFIKRKHTRLVNQSKV